MPEEYLAYPEIDPSAAHYPSWCVAEQGFQWECACGHKTDVEPTRTAALHEIWRHVREEERHAEVEAE